MNRNPSPFLSILLTTTLGIVYPLQGDDWPQWLGPQRDGVWRETGIVEQFQENGPPVLWRKEINPGYAGPAVAKDRIFLIDRKAERMPERKRGDATVPDRSGLPGVERVVCFNATNGNLLWEHAYPCKYRIEYPSGPRATPLVRDGRVYTLGAMGDLRCLRTEDGQVLWSVNFVTQYAADIPTWGWAAHPLLDGDRLITLVGGSNSTVVAFQKETGREIWRALNAREIGYAPPMIYEISGKRQLVIWHPDAITGLEPETGKTLWSMKYPMKGSPVRPGVTIASPRSDGRSVFVSEYYQGALMLDLSDTAQGPTVQWNRHGKVRVNFEDGLHTVMSTPSWKGRYLYGICGMGELRCLDTSNGNRIWETYAATMGKADALAQAFLIEQADRYFIWNDQGELILARFTPERYEELSRAKLLSPVENTRGRDVLWCHPAFSNRRLYVHNGKELICVSLAK